MDFENDSNVSPRHEARHAPVGKSKSRTAWRIFCGLLFGLSVVANIVLLLVVVGLAMVFATGQGNVFAEAVLEEGPKTQKIAIISIESLIDNEKAMDFTSQLKKARKDKHIKGLIIRVNSPGGTISASDRIYNQIQRYRQQTNLPVVAFMQAVAASGGYYTSVACEAIVAEPTVITGSIGVIMGHFVFQQLLEEKLGIVPVILKSGEKKDWPSPFRPTTDEQKEYLKKKIITPAYNRFVDIIAQARPLLGTEDVKLLADGSIFTADEALGSGLIDRIGYLDTAIELVKEQAGIEQAQVVEYRRPFSLAQFLRGRNSSALKITKEKLYELSIPELMYLWPGY